MSRRSKSFVLSISELLRPDEPIERIVHETAGVAVIVREGRTGEEFLLIERAERKGDPWSGQIALPGGRVEASDKSFRDTAVRESFEEVAVDLRGESFVGYLSAFQARTGSVWVVPSLFLLRGDHRIKPNSEVSSYRWVSLQDLMAGEKRTVYAPEWAEKRMEFPAFDLDGYLVWGLTERILATLAEAIARSRSAS